MRVLNYVWRHSPKPPRRSYWERRQRMVYLQHTSALVHYLAKDAKSLIDVGTLGCPYLEWFPWIPHKVSLDLRKPYSSANVRAITGDFLTLDINERFDFCLCLQVMEHVEDPFTFASKLLAVSSRVLISCPYRWNAGTVKNHIHDPIDREKISSWFGRCPDFEMISTEHNGTQRLLCYFNSLGQQSASGVSSPGDTEGA
jgi:hypothetical protein